MKTIKKIIFLALAVLMLVSVTGCGNEKEVKEKLCGEWGYIVDSINGPCYKIYTFKSDDTFESEWINENVPSKSSSDEGTYEIDGSKIVLTNKDGDIETVIEYTLENETLELVDKYSDNSGNRELIRID